MAVLEVEGLTRRFFGVIAVDHVSLAIRPGEIVGIIGPNGSGKTTLVNCISGILRPDGGRVFLDGQNITGFPPYDVALRGVGRSFQIVRIFPEMTAMESLLLAVQEHSPRAIWESFVRTPRQRAAEGKARERAEGLLEEVGLHAYRDLPAAVLSYGQRKLLNFATLLMPDPQVILLDEPMSAVNPTTIRTLMSRIARLAELGKSVGLIEHNMAVIMGLCTRVIVLHHGQKIAEGTPAEVVSDERVIDAYFGR